MTLRRTDYVSRDNGLELKVGLFVFDGVIALTFLSFQSAIFPFLRRAGISRSYSDMPAACARRRPCDCRGGCGIWVKKLQVFVDENDKRKTKVRVSIWTKDDISIPLDSKITINQLGILGKNTLRSIPGNSTDVVKDGSVLTGHDPVRSKGSRNRLMSW